MKKTKELKELIILLEDAIVPAVAASELRDYYRQKFSELLENFAKANYIRGNNDAHQAFKILYEKTQKKN